LEEFSTRLQDLLVCGADSGVTYHHRTIPGKDFAMRLKARHRASMLLLAIATPTVFAQVLPLGTRASAHRGDHPAVVIQRPQRTASHDDASKSSPHAARLYLLCASPDELERMHRAARAALIDTLPDDPEPGASARQ
jgi:hypothetical protein